MANPLTFLDPSLPPTGSSSSTPANAASSSSSSADANAKFLSISGLDFLMIELVPMARRVSSELLELSGEEQQEHPHQQHQRHSGSGSQPGLQGTQGLAGSAAGGSDVGGGGGDGGGPGSSVAGTGTGRKLDEEEERDALFYRLEAIGYRVGLGLAERFSRDRPRFNDTLDIIKFLCKDLWTLAFKKQIDNLKTNHRGVYVLTDHAFRPLTRMSTGAGGQAVALAQPFLFFPCGIVRGALAALGIKATVTADTNELPGAIFQIKTLSAKP